MVISGVRGAKDLFEMVESKEDAEIPETGRVFMMFNADFGKVNKLAIEAITQRGIKRILDEFDVRFLYVDTQHLPDITALHEVHDVPTYIAFKDGVELRRTQGNIGTPRLEKFLLRSYES